MKVFRAFLVALLVATIVWGVVFYESRQAYSAYTKDFYEEFNAWYRRYREDYGTSARHIDALPAPYWEWNSGEIIWNAGTVLLGAWLLSVSLGIAVIAGKRESETRRSD